MRSAASRSSSSTTPSATPTEALHPGDTGRLPPRITMKPIQVGLLGIGTVGGGTFEVLRRNQEEIRPRAGREIRVAMVADLDVARAKKLVGDAAVVVDDARRVIADPAI